MNKILLALLTCLLSATGMNAQSKAETWKLNKVEITETSSSGISEAIIPISDYKTLQHIMGPEEFSIISETQVNYKRIGADTESTILSYKKYNNAIEFELPECLLKLSIEKNDNELQLAEIKVLSTRDDTKTVTITYIYIR